MEAKRDLKLSKTQVYQQVSSLLRELHVKIARLYKQNVLCRVIPLPGTELRPVSFNKSQQNEEAFFQKHSWRALISPMFSSFPCGKHCFQRQFLFSSCKLCLRYTAGNFNENPSMRAFARNLRARASEHLHDLSNFCDQSEQKIGWDHSIPLLFWNFSLKGIN